MFWAFGDVEKACAIQSWRRTEGSYGFFKVMSRKPVARPQFDEPFGIRTAFTKRFPLGQFSQTVAQAAVEARPFVKNPDELAEVNVNVSRAAIKIMADGPDKWRPQTHETADHSIPCSAGLALLRQDRPGLL